MRSKQYTLDKEIEVKSLYEEGLEIKEICKIANVYKDYPTKIAKKYNISRGSGKKSSIKLDKFRYGSIESDYWLGYIISDGNIKITKRVSNISISSIDLEIKEKFLKYIPECNLYIRNNYLYSMYFGSKEIANYLISLGITPKKSKTIKLNIPLSKDILRGIFDGDGSVHNKRLVCKITTASEDLGNQIVDFLKNNDIFSKLRKRGNLNCYDVWIERKTDFEKFFELLYKDRNNNVYMERKYNKFVALLRDEQEKLGKNGEGCDS